jgi:transposase
MSGLQDVLVYRRGVLKDRTAAQARLKTARPKLLRRLRARRLAQTERQIGSVDGAMQAIVRADPGLRARLEILVSIPGISTVSATAILVDMPELGGLSGKPAAASAGFGVSPSSARSGSPAFVRAPESNECAERFIRTLKETLLRVRWLDIIEDLRQALLAFRQTSSEHWLIERHGRRPPPSDKSKP